MRAVLRDKSHSRVDQIWTKKESLSSFIQPTNFGELPGTVPNASCHRSRQQIILCLAYRGTLNEYRKCTMGLWCVLWRESKRGCCLRWGNKGALRLSGETSRKKTQQVQGSCDWTHWAEVPSCIHSTWWGKLITGSEHPLRAVGRQTPPRGTWGNGRAHLPPSVFWGTAPWSETEGPVWTDRVRKDPHRASTAGHRVGVGKSWKGWGRAESKEACSLRAWSCFLNRLEWGWGCLWRAGAGGWAL